MTKLESLKARENNLRKDLFEVQDEIKEVEENEQLPILIKSLEGKHFKYKNAYSSDKFWWMYVYVKKVKSVSEVIVNTFETRYDGECVFKIDATHGMWILETKCTPREYNKALSKFRKIADWL